MGFFCFCFLFLLFVFLLLKKRNTDYSSIFNIYFCAMKSEIPAKLIKKEHGKAETESS